LVVVIVDDDNNAIMVVVVPAAALENDANEDDPAPTEFTLDPRLDRLLLLVVVVVAVCVVAADATDNDNNNDNNDDDGDDDDDDPATSTDVVLTLYFLFQVLLLNLYNDDVIYTVGFMNSISIIIVVISELHNRCFWIFVFDPIVVHLIEIMFGDDPLPPVDSTSCCKKSSSTTLTWDSVVPPSVAKQKHGSNFLRFCR